jgi:hypothetical protein
MKGRGTAAAAPQWSFVAMLPSEHLGIRVRDIAPILVRAFIQKGRQVFGIAFIVRRTDHLRGGSASRFASGNH